MVMRFGLYCFATLGLSVLLIGCTGSDVPSPVVTPTAFNAAGADGCVQRAGYDVSGGVRGEDEGDFGGAGGGEGSGR